MTFVRRPSKKLIERNYIDLDKQYIQTEAALSQHLGVRVVPDPTDAQKKTVVGSLKDPKCRFV